MSLSARRGTIQRAEKWDGEGGRDARGWNFIFLTMYYIQLSLLLLTKDLGVLWKQRWTKGNPSVGLLWSQAILMASRAVGEAQPPGKGRRWTCRMLWSLPCCEWSAELHPLEALLVRVGTFLTVCIVPEHFIAHTMPVKIFPFFSCPAKNLTLTFSGHPLVCLDPSSWVKRLCFLSFFLHGLSGASCPCLPASCANPSLLLFIVEALLFGKVIMSLPGTSAAPSAGVWQGEKWCAKFLLGPKQSHKVILYMDKLVRVFICKGMDQEKFGLGSASRAGTPWLALCLWTLLCIHSPNPTCVFCCDFKPCLSTFSLCHSKSLLRLFRWQLHFCVAFESLDIDLLGVKGDSQPFSLLLFAWPNTATRGDPG